MIAQALGEYGAMSGAMSAVMDGARSIGLSLEEFGREWGLTGAIIVIVAALVWRGFTRIK